MSGVVENKGPEGPVEDGAAAAQLRVALGVLRVIAERGGKMVDLRPWTGLACAEVAADGLKQISEIKTNVRKS